MGVDLPILMMTDQIGGEHMTKRSERILICVLVLVAIGLLMLKHKMGLTGLGLF